VADDYENDTGWLEDPAVQRLCGYWPSSSSSHLVQRGRKLVKKYTLLQRVPFFIQLSYTW